MDGKLLNSATKFNLACLDKLGQKEKEGWGGWDWECCKTSFEKRIKYDAKREFTQKSLINIANYCMFLWNLAEKKNDIKQKYFPEEIIDGIVKGITEQISEGAEVAKEEAKDEII